MIGRQKGGATMAKRKTKKAVTKDQMTVISIKTTVAFHDWIAKIASAERSTIVQILEKGVVEYGDKRGFKDAPKRTIR
jgi:hypothetical protein